VPGSLASPLPVLVAVVVTGRPSSCRSSCSFSQYVSTIEWLKTRLTAAGECRDLVWKGAAALMYVKNELPLLQLRAKALVARREL